MSDPAQRMIRVAHLTDVHTADDMRIYHKECRALAGSGFRVTLVAPECESALAGVAFRPIAKASTRLRRMILGPWRVLVRAIQADADIYHLHDPELIPVGLILKLLRKRVIYDAHEDLPKQILTKAWIAPALRRAMAGAAKGMEWAAGSLFDGVIAATPAIAREFPGPKRPRVVQNFPIEGELSRPAASAVPYDERSNQLTYLGGMTRIRGIREIVKAMEFLPEELGVTLALIGAFSEPGLEEECKALAGWTRVREHGWQDRQGVADLLGQSRAGLVLFLPAPNHLEAQPNKLFEYMSSGIPVVASHFPLWREIVNEAQCGVVVDPEDPEAIAAGIARLLADPEAAKRMGSRGREAVASRYNWEHEKITLLAVYKEVSQ